MKNERKLYELCPSQNVIILQTKYTLWPKVVNIVFSATKTENLDFDLLDKAFNLVVKRNDCLRIRFVKQNKQLMQYFLEEDEVIFDDIAHLTFNTKEEQEKFINKVRSKAIKYMKGEQIIPYFIKTYDGKSMVLFKVNHIVLDIYGIDFIFNDLFSVYDALKNNTELPEKPGKYEDVIIEDLKRFHNEYSYNECKEFFENYFNTHEEPYYAGVAADRDPIWVKQVKKNKRAQKMFFINNDTIGYERIVKPEVVEPVLELCKELNLSPTTVFFYACSLCNAIANNYTTTMLPLELCNCRGTSLEKNCAGCKVQSVGSFTEVDYDKSFIDNLHLFAETQNKLYRRYYFPDQDFEMLIHKTYKSSMLETYYGISFSFVPYIKRKDVEYCIYSNGKGALPCYLVSLFDVETNEIRMGYDVQSKITKEEDVDRFHANYISILKQIVANPHQLAKDFVLEEK